MIATVTLNPALDRLLEIERLSADDANRVLLERHYAAGKGVDASRVIHELGGNTTAYGMVGGMEGAEITHRLEADGIHADFTEVEGDTRTNLLLHERSTGKQYLINAQGPRVAPEKLDELLERLYRKRGSFRAMIVSGSIPQGLPDSAYRTLVERMEDVKVFVDADGDVLKQAVEARPWAIKPNRHEASRLLGRTVESRAESLQAAHDIVTFGIQHVLLSMGKAGAVLAHGGQVWFGRSPEVQAISAVGSGDSMVAAYTLKLCQGFTPEEAFAWGLAAGAATALTPGTELCHREDVERLVREVSVEPVEA